MSIGYDPTFFDYVGSKDLYVPDSHADSLSGNGGYASGKFGNTLQSYVDRFIPLLTGEAQYNWNSALQEDAQKYNSTENHIARMHNSYEAHLARQHSSAEAELTRQFNSKEANIQRLWQEKMSNTAYQRAVADMEKAGLNPYLAYAQGGAPISSGSSASASNASTSMASGSAASSNANSVSSSPMISMVNTLLSSTINSAVDVAKFISNNNINTLKNLKLLIK